MITYHQNHVAAFAGAIHGAWYIPQTIMGESAVTVVETAVGGGHGSVVAQIRPKQPELAPDTSEELAVFLAGVAVVIDEL